MEAERRGARARARARAREGDGDARERGDQTVEDARLPVGIGRRLGVAGEVVRGERHASWRGGVQHVVERVSARRGKEARARARLKRMTYERQPGEGKERVEGDRGFEGNARSGRGYMETDVDRAMGFFAT